MIDANALYFWYNGCRLLSGGADCPERNKKVQKTKHSKGESFFARLIKGLAIGVAAILPGASGGVLAVSMGVYRPALDAITGLFKSFVPCFMYLLPLGIGGLVGVFGTGRIMESVLAAYKISAMWALIGMVLGGLPSLIKEANSRGFKPTYLIATLIGAALIGGCALLQHHLGGGKALPFNGWTALLGGALIGLGSVIPGISTSFIMIYLGIYEPFLTAFNSLNIPMLLCAAAGVIAVVALLITGIKKLFDRHYGYAYYGAMGLLLTSAVLIYPGFRTGWKLAIDAALFIACFVITYFLCKLPTGNEDAGTADIIEKLKTAKRG